MNARQTWAALAVALLVTVSGCGGSRLVKVTGKVTYRGQPVPSTLVTFLPESGSRPSKGLTDDNGNFNLRYSRQEAGATRGACTVVLQYVPSNEEELGKIGPKASKELKEVIRRYQAPEKSSLHYEIARSGDHFEIALE
jgi:hypothetical protein